MDSIDAVVEDLREQVLACADIDAEKAMELIASQATATDEDISSAMDFYAGRQWASEVRNKMLTQGRSPITINLLPQLVKRVELKLRAAGLSLTDREQKLLIAAFVRKARDPQMIYNYEVTKQSEFAKSAQGHDDNR